MKQIGISGIMEYGNKVTDILPPGRAVGVDGLSLFPDYYLMRWLVRFGLVEMVDRFAKKMKRSFNSFLMTGREPNDELVTERVVVERKACANWRSQRYNRVGCDLSNDLSASWIGQLHARRT